MNVASHDMRISFMAYKLKHPTNTNWTMLCFSMLIFFTGLILFLDEVWMFNPAIGHAGWILGDWSWLHLEPFHHWMLGVIFMIVAIIPIIYAVIKGDDLI